MAATSFCSRGGAGEHALLGAVTAQVGEIGEQERVPGRLRQHGGDIPDVMLFEAEDQIGVGGDLRG